MAWYNQQRRKLRSELGLVSLAAPLDRSSAERVLECGADAGLESNTTLVHVTFAEGLLNQTPDLSELQDKLEAEPELEIIGFECVPTRYNKNFLVTATVQWHATVDTAVQNLLATAMLPQYPPHVALGVTKYPALEQLNDLIGTTIRIVPGRLTVLPPPPLPETVPPHVGDLRRLLSSTNHRDDQHKQKKKKKSNSEKRARKYRSKCRAWIHQGMQGPRPCKPLPNGQLALPLPPPVGDTTASTSSATSSLHVARQRLLHLPLCRPPLG